MVAEEQADDHSLADRLDHLFRTVVKADGSHFSHREAAEVISRDHEPISHTYIGQLRTGERDNPTIKHLRALAAFFGVPVEYFTSENLAQQVDQELELLNAVRDLRANPQIQTLVVRARGFSPESLDSVAEIMEQIRRIEGRRPKSGGTR